MSEMKTKIVIYFLVCLLFFSTVTFSSKLISGSIDEHTHVTLEFNFKADSAYEVTDCDDMYQVINMNGFDNQFIPGNPLLPYKSFKILVHPDIIWDSINIQITDKKMDLIDGGYEIKPAGPIYAEGSDEPYWGEGKEIVDGKNIDVYNKDQIYPEESISNHKSSQMRKWKFFTIDFYPFQYNPVTEKIYHTKQMKIKCSYDRTGNGLDEKFAADHVMDDIASELFFNYEMGNNWYIEKSSSLQSIYNYVIITTNAIQSNSNKLNNFIVHKQNIGNSVLLITEDEYGSLNGQAPNGLSEKIRQWLIDNYVGYGIEYVLLIGDPDPDDPSTHADSIGDVPMKMCWPRFGSDSNSEYNETPTDYFYADLTGNWNIDADSYFGEHDDDYGVPGGVDLTPEVLVGRIPVYDNDYSSLDSILQKIIDYENDIENDSWRNKVLLPMSYSNAGGDSGEVGDSIKDFLLDPQGFSSWRMYQQGSAYSEDDSVYYSEEELRGIGYEEPSDPYQNNVKDRWAADDFGIVCWKGHGSYMHTAVGYSDNSDGNMISNYDCAVLDDDHPSFTFQISCNNGWPEEHNNLGYSLLKNGAIATIPSSRVSWYTLYGYGNYDNKSFSTGLAYNYIKYLIQNHSAGYSLYYVKSNINVGGMSSLMNRFDFNLYGDPSIRLFQIENDIQPYSINYPTEDISAGGHIVNATIKNNGYSNHQDVMINCTILDGVYATFIDEDFNGPFPPEGWSVEEENECQVQSGSNAGGTSPELRIPAWFIEDHFAYIDTSMSNTIGSKELYLEFNHYLWVGIVDPSDYVRVYARNSSSETWTIIAEWDESNIQGNVGPEQQILNVSAFIGDETQIRFEIYGDNLDWYLDDIKLYTSDVNSESCVYSSEKMIDIDAFESCYVDFDAEWMVYSPGIYSIVVTSFLTDDQFPGNDEHTKVISVLPDDISPVISNIVDYPDPQSIDGHVNISCVVTDDVLLDSVYVDVTGPNGYHENLSMIPSIGNTFYRLHNYDEIGQYSYFIWANDTFNNVVSSSPQTFTIIENLNPISDFHWMPSSPIVNNSIQFYDDSIDTDGTIISWMWDFGDGNTSSDQQPLHSYGISGEYQVCLTVVDNDNGLNMSCKSISITSGLEVLDVNQSSFNRGFPIRHAVDGDWAGAQNFNPTMSAITKVDLYVRSFGTPEFDLVVELREDGPEGTLLDTVTFTPGEVGSSWDWFTVDFADVTVDSDTDYFIVIPPAPSGVTSSFGYEWGYAFGDQYDDGSFWFTRDGGNLWRDLPTMYDFSFKTYGYI